MFLSFKTTLSFFDEDCVRIGIDFTGSKFKDKYEKIGAILVPHFFPPPKLDEILNGQKAKLISSYSCFYDLPDPVYFAQKVHDCLADDGIWCLEQSYMPSMLRTNSYDTICHEHIEYYSLNNILYILDLVNMKIVDIQFNSINGGSFAITAAKKNSVVSRSGSLTNWLLKQESRMGFDTPIPFRKFEERVFNHRLDLMDLLKTLKSDGYKIAGYGASTKGNVIIQFCGITKKMIPYAVERNPEKFGRYTPGSFIPIISEKRSRVLNPDFFLVMPWHFKKEIVSREKLFLNKGGKLIFPLPNIHMVGKK